MKIVPVFQKPFVTTEICVPTKQIMACHGFKHLCWLNIGDHYYSINKWVFS